MTKQFIELGIKHIWTGYDHILFLLSVILLMRIPKKILLLVTSFTIAHSLTLLLAGFHVLEIPSDVVEPLIAFSIVYTAFRNVAILRKKEKEVLVHGWFTTFGFGLIHGLGFASILNETYSSPPFFHSLPAPL